MKKTLKILRRKSPEEKPYFESFTYESSDEGATVATALMEISRRSDLVWEHSCLQKKCGACAMIIDGKPVLACDTRLSECKGETVVVEPLRKFPVVKDLLVDRSAVAERMNALKVYPVSIKEPAKDPSAKQIRRGERDDETAFEASRCIQCGLCLEVCPNFTAGESFFGAAAFVPASRILSQLPKGKKYDLVNEYGKHIYSGCGKSLSCHNICPVGIDIEHKLSNSNAVAVWKRFFKK